MRGPETILLALALLTLSSGVVGQSDEYCDDDICSYDFSYHKVQTMVYYHFPPVPYVTPENTGFRLYEELDGGVYRTYYYFIADDNAPPPPVLPPKTYVDPADYADHGVIILDGFYRTVDAINGQIPGPMIEVKEDAVIDVRVTNDDITGQGMSIHWHGIFQLGTPWLDGVGLITQCNQMQGTSFQYTFRANPHGSFWYHSHTGLNRGDGIYGPIVIHKFSDLNAAPVDRGYDHDFFYTSVIDWYREQAHTLFLQQRTGIVADIGEQIGFTRGMHDGNLAVTNIYPPEGLVMNSFGQRYDGTDIIGEKRFHQYDVEAGKKYRFRFMSAALFVIVKISFDEHTMALRSVDGFDTGDENGDYITDLHYIVLHSGQRLDVIVDMNRPVENYWVRSKTFEKDNLPLMEALAVLHYDGAADPHDVHPTHRDWTCITDGGGVGSCNMFPCQWDVFPDSAGINCLYTYETRNIDHYPDNRLPTKHDDEPFIDTADLWNGTHVPQGPADYTYFLNWGFPNTLNNIHYHHATPYPLWDDHEIDPHYLCPEILPNGRPNCPGAVEPCGCLNLLELPYGAIVDFVWFSHIRSFPNEEPWDPLSGAPPPFIAGAPVFHPIHLHGHAFYILGEGLPEYDPVSDTYLPNKDIQCTDAFCQTAEWANVPTNLNYDHAPRMDTFSIAPGGWAVARIVTDNPGTWAKHCHLELHTASMMMNLKTLPPPRKGKYRHRKYRELDFNANKPKGLPTCPHFYTEDKEHRRPRHPRRGRGRGRGWRRPRGFRGHPRVLEEGEGVAADQY